MGKRTKLEPEFSQRGLMELMDAADNISETEHAFLVGQTGATTISAVTLIPIVMAILKDLSDVNPPAAIIIGSVGLVGIVATMLLQKLKNNQHVKYEDIVAQVKTLANDLDAKGLLDKNKMTGEEHQRLDSQIDEANFYEEKRLKKLNKYFAKEENNLNRL